MLGGLKINIYVIIKQNKFREGFKKLLEAIIPSLKSINGKVIVETFTAIPAYIPKEIDLVIIEPSFVEEGRNIELIGHLSSDDYPVCTISEEIDDQQLLEIISLKVRGILFKSMNTKDLFEAIETCIHGGNYIPQKAAILLLEAYQP